MKDKGRFFSCDVERVLDALGIKFKRNGNELTAHCFSDRHVDKHPSWSIHSKKGDEKNGLFSCWSCKWSGTIIDVVMKKKKIDYADAQKFIEQFSNINQTFTIARGIKVLPKCVAEPELVIPIRSGSDCMAYLAERGFGKEEIERFGLKNWILDERLWIPIRRDGMLISWIGRTYAGKTPKVLTPKGEVVGARHSIFGFDLLDQTNGEIHITEGWASALRIYQAGFTNVIAFCGSQVTWERVSDLYWAEKLTIWEEGDLAGRRFSKDLKAWFIGCQIEVVHLPDGKDPADFTVEELNHLKGEMNEPI